MRRYGRIVNQPTEKKNRVKGQIYWHKFRGKDFLEHASWDGKRFRNLEAVRKRGIKRREENPEHMKKLSRESRNRRKNDPKRKMAIKKYNDEHKEERKEYNRKYREKNKEKIRKNNIKWQENNKEHVEKKRKERYQKNKEKIKKNAEIYRNNNREKINKKARERYNLKKKDEFWNLKEKVRKRILQVLKKGGTKRSETAEKALNMSIIDFHSFIECQFKDGMNWENQGQWHLDHVKCIDSFDLSDDQEFKQCFHWSNYQPLWADKNISKNNYYEEETFCHKWINDEVGWVGIFSKRQYSNLYH